MSFIKCIDIVTMVTDEATSRFWSILEVDKRKEHILKEACADIDTIANKCGCTSYEVNIDEITTNITVSVVCGEIIYDEEDPSDRFYGALCKAKRIEIKRAKDGNIQINFVFDGIWKCANVEELNE